MSEKDDAAAAYYSDPARRMSDGPGYGLPGRPARLTKHVPIRFDRDTIAAIKQFADDDGMTVSSWVRHVIEREIRRRSRSHTEVTSAASKPEGEIVAWARSNNLTPKNTTGMSKPLISLTLEVVA